MPKTRVLLLAAVLFFGHLASAQCAMCRAVLQTEDNSKQAEAVNDGIVYLMIFPYLLVAVIGYAIYRSRRKAKMKTGKL